MTNFQNQEREPKKERDRGREQGRVEIAKERELESGRAVRSHQCFGRPSARLWLTPASLRQRSRSASLLCFRSLHSCFATFFNRRSSADHRLTTADLSASRRARPLPARSVVFVCAVVAIAVICGHLRSIVVFTRLSAKSFVGARHT